MWQQMLVRQLRYPNQNLDPALIVETFHALANQPKKNRKKNFEYQIIICRTVECYLKPQSSVGFGNFFSIAAVVRLLFWRLKIISLQVFISKYV